jgi:hypothetical protein
MLLLIGQVYIIAGGTVPSNRGLLFQRFVTALLQRERQTRPERWLNAEIQSRVLSELAFAIQREYGVGTSAPPDWARKQLTESIRRDGRETEHTVDDLLYLAKSASILEESGDGSLRFTHQLLQEYFAATALLAAAFDKPMLRGVARYPQWDEVFVLLAGLQSDATALVELLRPIDPYLAARCVSAAHAVESTIRSELLAELKKKAISRFRAERIATARGRKPFGRGNSSFDSVTQR